MLKPLSRLLFITQYLRRLVVLLLLTTFLLPFVFTLSAMAADIAYQRQQFLQSFKAVKQGHYQHFTALSETLRTYPLYPYLQSASLEYRLSYHPTAEVNDFLARYAGTPLAYDLRSKWLVVLAKQGRWSEFRSYYQPTMTSASFQCLNSEALLYTIGATASFSGLNALWLTGQNLPPACGPIFKQWRKSGMLTPSLLWQRINLAIQANNKGLLIALTKLLPVQEQPIVKFWQKMYADPQKLTKAGFKSAAGSQAGAIIVSSLKQLARKNPDRAMALWLTLQGQYSLTDQQRGDLLRALAISLAVTHAPSASVALANVPSVYVDASVREWRIRAALLDERWNNVLYWIRQLPPDERSSPNWRYWEARALAAQGQTQQANAIYRFLAPGHDYYGLMSSTQLKQPYAPRSAILKISTQELNVMAQRPSLVRSQELYRIHWISQARREWEFALKKMSPHELAVAAKLAQTRGWYDRAIITATQSDEKNDLNIRFPLAYRDYVLFEARQSSLDPAWVFAIIRQESLFMADAKSPVGAVGLMQLMPMTAKQVAGRSYRNLGMLEDASTNIRVGCRYMHQLMITFRGNIVQSTAAYNAGPTPVVRWLAGRSQTPEDVWVETIPWHETRNYVKNVSAYRAIYAIHIKGAAQG